MKSLLVSQRVDILHDRDERRDALDQRLPRFLRACGFLSFPVPNDPDQAASTFDRVRPNGVVLSGGNDLGYLGGDAPERDATEQAIVKLAGQFGLPVVGICRGLQFLVHSGGGSLVQACGHLDRHFVRGLQTREVNSYHRWKIASCGPGWEVFARAHDDSIEFAGCASQRQSGIMWHPEREATLSADDVKLFRELLAPS